MSDHICLIVDDEPVIRTYLRAIVEREQMQTLEAGNAAQALGIIHKLDGRLDLVVTDIKMPGDMDGLDLERFNAGRRRSREAREKRQALARPAQALRGVTSAAREGKKS